MRNGASQLQYKLTQSYTAKVPNKLLKYGGQELVDKLTTLFNKSLTTSNIPKEWHSSIIIPTFKKGQKTQPENYNNSLEHHNEVTHEPEGETRDTNNITRGTTRI